MSTSGGQTPPGLAARIKKFRTVRDTFLKSAPKI
nr:MAG TPA: hypothetical protein [Caudoviricetes sp.]DAJ51401.1 MAG TPA: hypothetical protein [Caudoviricetes sp.]